MLPMAFPILSLFEANPSGGTYCDAIDVSDVLMLPPLALIRERNQDTKIIQAETLLSYFTFFYEISR